MQPEIGIVLLNWNNWPDTLACLTNLAQISYPQDRLDIYVVDNGSENESILHLRSQPGIRLIESAQNLGFAGGNNLGIRAALEAGCEFILLLNSDTTLTPNFIDQLLQTFENDPQAGIVSPKIYYAGPPDKIWYAGGKFHQPRILGELIGMGESDTGQYDLARKVDFAVGCCMLVRREVFAQVGNLDDNLFFYHEDVDFSLRAGQAGYTIWYQPQAVIVHRVSSSTSRDLPQREFLYPRARTFFLIKHIRGIQILLVILMEVIRLLRTITIHTWQRRPDLASSYIRGLAQGLKDARKSFITPKIPIKRLISLSIAIPIFTFLGYRAYLGIQQLFKTGIR